MIYQIKPVVTGESAGLKNIYGKLEIAADETVIIQPYNARIIFLVAVNSSDSSGR